MSLPVLATKLHAPVHRGRLVPRARLFESLDVLLEPGQRLALVSAPAGFGKSTLVSTWTQQLPPGPQGGSRVAWISLDADDNDLRRLLAHLLEALARAGAPLALDHAIGTSVMSLDAASALMRAVINALEHAATQTDAAAPEQGQPLAPDEAWILVLDDYHVITAPEVHETLGYLLDHQPERLRVLIATRADPPLPVARLRSRGQLVEVRAADLRFTHDEADTYFGQVMQLDLEPTHVRALDDRTEGWAAGLQLAGLSLRGRTAAQDVADFVHAFTGSNRFVVDYLADEVLANQPAEVRSFLLRTSVLDRLTGSLCDAITGTTGGAQMLARLDRENLFVVPLDDERTWYRYHHLFSDVLRARLTADEPESAARLHATASDWYAAQESLEEAVRHAFAAQDHARAGRLVERGLAQLRRERRDSLMLTWLHALPADVVSANPVLSTAVGWSAMVAGDLGGLERHLDDADALLAAAAADPTVATAWEQTDDLETAAASVHMYRAALAQARGHRDDTESHARTAIELARPQDHFVRGAGYGFLGLAAWARGDIEDAIGTFEQAAESLRTAGNHVDALDTTIVLVDMWVTAGHPTRARDLCEQALAVATEHGEPYPRATADLHTCLAELAVGRDALAEAADELRTASALAESAHITENRHRWPAVSALRLAASGNHRAAADHLDEALELYRPGFYPNLRPLDATRARLALMAGDLVSAERWAGQSGLQVDDDPEFAHEYAYLTLARVVLARNDVGAATAGYSDPEPGLADVAQLLDALESAATRTARHGSTLEIRLLRALFLSAQGDLPGGARMLATAIEEAPEVEGFRRLFLDEGARMTVLLEAVARDGAASASAVTSATRLLGPRMPLVHDASVAGRAVAGASTPPGGALVSPLSDREQEVLRLLQSELSGPEIAGQLFISLNTLRTHTKRIFTKLDVTSRAAAVRRGRELRLI